MAPASSPNTAVYYVVPEITTLLSTGSFLYLLRVMEHLSNLITNTHLLGSLLFGILWASPHVGNLLSPAINSTFTLLGYIGLLLLIFEAGLTTPLALLVNPTNLALSMVVAATGIAVPFALSFALLHGAYGYTVLQTFGAGAALCSTSLGTTIALLDKTMRQKTVGVVLMTAALADDVVGLVIAGIVGNLGADSGTIHWSKIVRPVLVSLAFTFTTPAAAMFARKRLYAVPPERDGFGKRCIQGVLRKVSAFGHGRAGAPEVYLFLIVFTLPAFVTGAYYAGTSELYGAYLAGTFLSYIFEPAKVTAEGATPSIEPDMAVTSSNDLARPVTRRSSKQDDNHLTEQPEDAAPMVSVSNAVLEKPHPIQARFERTIHPLLTNLLSPLFFASIGASLPVQNLFSINPPIETDATSTVLTHDVIWKGIVYSILMIIAKVVTGIWILLWPEGKENEGHGTRASLPSSGDLREDGSENGPTGPSAFRWRLPGAMFVGLAMVARGEIALIVAQLARPILTGDNGDGPANEEPFAVVIWAILVTTLAGAVGVGIVLRRADLK